jgi:chemotaxis protein histidine kinase CheA
LGGSAVIDAAPGKGTRIRMDLPLLLPFASGKTNLAE